MINNDSGYKFNPGTIVTHGTSMGLWFPALEINRTKAGINGIAGMPMVGINGHLGLLVAMMMIGGRRGHNGTANQRSTGCCIELVLFSLGCVATKVPIATHPLFCESQVCNLDEIKIKDFFTKCGVYQ